MLGASQWLLLDMDSPAAPINPQAPHCDFLFFGSAGKGGQEWIVPLELKEGDVRASEIVRQLQEGANAASGLIPQGAAIRFRPVVASGRIDKIERRELLKRSNKIGFRGHVEAVRRIRCGSPLADAL